MERITPARRDPAVKIRLGPTNTGSEAVAASQHVMRSIGSGKITPSEGEKITSVLENRRKVIETAERTAESRTWKRHKERTKFLDIAGMALMVAGAALLMGGLLSTGTICDDPRTVTPW